MAALATQIIAQAGTTPTYAAAAGGGDTFIPGDKVFLHVKNAGGSPQTVTIDSKVPSNYGVDNDLAVVVPATTGDKMIGPLPASRFQDPTTGVGNITYTGVTSLTIAVVTL